MPLARLPALGRLKTQEVVESAPAPVLPRLVRGDKQAFSELLDRYGNLIWTLARRYLGNRADAEDATQDVLLELWRSADRFDPARASEATFIAMIARRRLIDRRRKRRRTPEAGPLPEALACPDGGAHRLDQSEDVARAIQALDALRETPRRLLLMSVVHGRTHGQIAEETGLPLGTIKAHIRRGLLSVRASLAGAGS